MVATLPVHSPRKRQRLTDSPRFSGIVSSLFAMALAVLVSAPLFVAPASSEPSQTDEEIERLSRVIAIDAVGYAPLRWRPTRFPLKVAFSTDETLKTKMACPDYWRSRVDEYQRFMNAKQPLLSSIARGDTSAAVFFGSFAKHISSREHILESAWLSKPGVSILIQTLDQYSHSYKQIYGVGDFIEFAAVFRELDEASGECSAFDPTVSIAGALFPSYVALINAQVYRLRNGRPDTAVEWSAQRRLLSAIKKLPETSLTAEALRLALVQTLSNE